MLALDSECLALQGVWRKRPGPVRSDDSATNRLAQGPAWNAPPHRPGGRRPPVRSGRAVNDAYARLTDANVWHQTTVARRTLAFEARAVIRWLLDLERRLAVPVSDTRLAPRARPAPRRRQDPGRSLRARRPIRAMVRMCRTLAIAWRSVGIGACRGLRGVSLPGRPATPVHRLTARPGHGRERTSLGVGFAHTLCARSDDGSDRWSGSAPGALVSAGRAPGRSLARVSIRPAG